DAIFCLKFKRNVLNFALVALVVKRLVAVGSKMAKTVIFSPFFVFFEFVAALRTKKKRRRTEKGRFYAVYCRCWRPRQTTKADS
ncbi:hypothetical protein, partial [Runella sp.]|uniref:hypothetical protein n=1 Tax=Runella sp. TaxID=1960881 RepID=UPI00301A6EAE